MEAYELTQQTNDLAQKYPQWFALPKEIASVKIGAADNTQIEWVLDQLDAQPPMALLYILHTTQETPDTDWAELIANISFDAKNSYRTKADFNVNPAWKFHFALLAEQYGLVGRVAESFLIASSPILPEYTDATDKPHYTPAEEQDIITNWGNALYAQDPAMVEQMMAEMIAGQTFPPQKPAK